MFVSLCSVLRYHRAFLPSGKNLKESLVTLEEDLVKLKDELQHVAQSIPNMTHPDVPVGGEDSSAIRQEVSYFCQNSLNSCVDEGILLSKVFLKTFIIFLCRLVVHVSLVFQ